MLLAMDIGNSTVALGLFDGGTFVSRRQPTDLSRSAENQVKALESFLQWAEAGSELEGIIICSVVPAVCQTMKAALRRLFTLDPLEVSPEMTGGLTLDVEQPETVGPDRIASAVAAATMLGTPVVVVDFGTATTVNIIDSGGSLGVYRGGAIMPGINMMFRALSEHTASLPLVGPSGALEAIGRTTSDNIRAGVLLGTAGGVERLIREAASELEGDIKVAVTGGMMEYVGSHLPQADLAEPDLVLKGLRAIYEHERKAYA
jgi:type III pantothenate kinase